MSDRGHHGIEEQLAVVRYRLDLDDGDVTAIEVIEQGSAVRMAIYDRDSTVLPLIHADLDEGKCADLIRILLGYAPDRVVRSGGAKDGKR